jgi:hypothetical protein
LLFAQLSSQFGSENRGLSGAVAAVAVDVGHSVGVGGRRFWLHWLLASGFWLLASGFWLLPRRPAGRPPKILCLRRK